MAPSQRLVGAVFAVGAAIGLHFLAPALLNQVYPIQNHPKQVGGNNDSAKPFYAIAHRVLTAQGVQAAIDHGANALEVDLTAWSKGWWADHSGTVGNLPLPIWGDSAKTLFQTVADLRMAGKTIVFVWLDIKNPDFCDPNSSKWRHCSIDGLRELARDILEPAGVQVLYGFDQGTVKGKAYQRIVNGLNTNEAVNLNGRAAEVAQQFSSLGPETSRRVLSYGFPHLPTQFGECDGKDSYTCDELRKASESGNFNQVSGWVLAPGQSEYAEKLLGTANIDGLIYGFKLQSYKNKEGIKDAMKLVHGWLADHPDKRYLARQSDKPW